MTTCKLCHNAAAQWLAKTPFSATPLCNGCRNGNAIIPDSTIFYRLLTADCAICGQHSECYDDGEAYICLDRAACGKRELLARIESLQEQNAKLRGDAEMAQEALANQTRYAQKLERQHGAAVDTIEHIGMERDALADACKAALRMLNAKQAPSPNDLMVLHTQLSRALKPLCPICRAPLRDGACPDAAAHDETERMNR